MTVKGYAKFLLIMAGLGGLLYGVDVGVIAAALPYIERTSTFNQAEAEKIPNLVVGGRLGGYKYFDMDQTIAAALALDIL